MIAYADHQDLGHDGAPSFLIAELDLSIVRGPLSVATDYEQLTTDFYPEKGVRNDLNSTLFFPRDRV